MCRHGELGRGESRIECSCAWEPHVTVGVKRNELSTSAGRKRARGRTKGAKINVRQENNNKNGTKGIKGRIWEMRNRICGGRGELSEGLSENVIVKADLPIKTNSYSHQGHSSVFVP